MFSLNKEQAFINFYVMDKEYGLTRVVRYALNQIHYFEREKGYERKLAIHIVNNMINAKEGIDLTKPFLWKMYRKRLAYVKHAKDAFRTWDIEKRIAQAPKQNLNYCECGCGTIIKPGRRFVNGHNARCRSKKENEELAENMRDVRRKKKNMSKIVYL